MKRKFYNCASRVLGTVTAITLVLGMMPTTALAYDRQEETTTAGGTEITVYSGLVNSNDVDPYLEEPGDYLAYNQYYTAGSVVSTSNITSSTNFVKTTAGTVEGTETTVHGGVEGVSWDNETNTLTLNQATGTVITIEGPEIIVSEVNTYNSNLTTLVDLNVGNLTYYKQVDVLNEQPHTKENFTEQDIVYINIEGENSFDHICLSGNVQVVFTGTGTLTLEAVQTWDYDDYGEPGYDVKNLPSSAALASYPTIGLNGSLNGEVNDVSEFPNGWVRDMTETYEYALPEIVLGEGMEILEGGEIYNVSQITDETYFTYIGEVDVLDESHYTDAALTADSSCILTYDGTNYRLLYDAEQDVYFVDAGDEYESVFYDLTADVSASAPWQSYVGTEGVPAQKVVICATES